MSEASFAIYRANQNRRHAMRRAMERYGISLSMEQVLHIEATIEHGGGDVRQLNASRDDASRILCKVLFGGVCLPVVYDVEFRSVVTFLSVPLRYRIHAADVPVPDFEDTAFSSAEEINAERDRLKALLVQLVGRHWFAKWHALTPRIKAIVDRRKQLKADRRLIAGATVALAEISA